MPLNTNLTFTGPLINGGTKRFHAVTCRASHPLPSYNNDNVTARSSRTACIVKPVVVPRNGISAAIANGTPPRPIETKLHSIQVVTMHGEVQD